MEIKLKPSWGRALKSVGAILLIPAEDIFDRQKQLEEKNIRMKYFF